VSGVCVRGIPFLHNHTTNNSQDVFADEWVCDAAIDTEFGEACVAALVLVGALLVHAPMGHDVQGAGERAAGCGVHPLGEGVCVVRQDGDGGAQRRQPGNKRLGVHERDATRLLLCIVEEVSGQPPSHHHRV